MRLTITLIGLLTVQFMSAQNLEDGLLLHYPMSGNADDISGNGFHGDVNATLSEDRFGNPNEAYHFNGINEFIDFPNEDELKPPMPLTIAFWIKYDDTPNTDRAVFNTSLEEDVNSGVFFTSESATGKYAMGFGDGDPVYNTGSIRKYVSNTIIDMEDWHHITLVYTSASDMKIYVDCVEAGGIYGGLGGPLQYSPMPGTIGRHDQSTGVPAYYFEGSIDEFRYWNRALTIEEIDLVCTEEPLVFDCPELELNIGDSCDDGNESTINDLVTETCECVGTPIEPVCNWVTYLNDNHDNQTDIYGIELVDGEAQLTHLTTLDYMAHIAYNPYDELLYVVNNTTGYYVVVNPHTSPVEVSQPVSLGTEIPSITTATFAPNGKLLVGSSTDEIIYCIDVADNEVTVFDGFAPVHGGDLEFDDTGMMYLATRRGNSLFQVYPEDVMSDQFLGSIDHLVTGMALTADLQLIISHQGNPNLVLYNLNGVATGDVYPLILNGVPFEHHNGDMASGCYSGMLQLAPTQQLSE